METLTIRNVTFGEGAPKICLPIMGENREEIIEQARQVAALSPDLAEWRADSFLQCFSQSEVDAILSELRESLQTIPLLFTFRTAGEGGMQKISLEKYRSLNQAVIDQGIADLIDIECFFNEKLTEDLISYAHKKSIRVIASNHDFEKTPPKESILYRLRRMQEMDADIPKIAVMPQNKKDVLTLLEATLEMSELYADRPIVSMSMARSGMISRLAGEVFGSAITFGSAGRESAPGQIDAADLRTVLELIHKNLL